MLESFFLAAVAFTSFFLFWPLVILFFVVVGVLYRDDWAWAGFFWFVLPLVGVYLLFNGLTVPDWKKALLFIGIYAGAGFSWSLLRWMLAVNLWRSEVERVKSEAANWSHLDQDEKVKRLERQTDNRVQAIIEYKDLHKLDILPKLVNNKARVSRWIIFWPLSFLNYLFDRFLKDLVDAILNRLAGFYNWLARQMMGDVKV